MPTSDVIMEGTPLFFLRRGWRTLVYDKGAEKECLRMDVKCPHCGTGYEVEKKDMYHYTTCEVCGKGFVIGATTSLLSSGGPATSAARLSASRAFSSPASSYDKKFAHAEENQDAVSTNAVCPHCGTEYEVARNEIGRAVTCQICGKDFVVKVLHKRPGISMPNPKQRRDNYMSEKRRRSRLCSSTTSVAREFQEYAQEKEESSTIAVIIGSLFIFGLVAFIVFPKLGTVARNMAWNSGKNSIMQTIDGVSIEKLGGNSFEKTNIMGADCFIAYLPSIEGFAPNVNVLFEVFKKERFPALGEYVHRAFQDYEKMGCTVRLLERKENWITMGASGNGFSYDVKIIREESRCRFVVVTGTMRTDILVVGAQKKDKTAESVAHKIVHCVHSARL